MNKEVFINMEMENFTGAVLDIGFKNYGVVYTIFKKYNSEAEVDYFCGKNEKKQIEEGFYDTIVLFFSLHTIWFKRNKRTFIKDIQKYLKEEGIIYLWDIDKGYREVFHKKIKMVLPKGEIKNICIKDRNILKDNSKKNTLKILEGYFDILDVKGSDNIYFIKGKKKGIQNNENTTSRDEFKICT